MKSAGRELADQDSLLSALENGTFGELVSSADQVMLDYSLKLTRNPQSITKDDIHGLRLHDFDDRGIHDICAITSYYAFVNRIADGLGVELEDRFDSSNH